MVPADSKKVGWIDPYSNYRIEMPTHHVYTEERNFFSRYLFSNLLVKEKEYRVESFSKAI